MSPDDDFALLRLLGQDCAGALTLDPTKNVTALEPWGWYRALTPSEIGRFTQHPESITAMLGDKTRLSAAGTQYKLPVRKESDGTLCVPHGSAASTHLLKCASRDFSALVENEYLCLTLAREVGLNVVSAELISSGGRHLLLVERYDRFRVDPPPDGVPPVSDSLIALPTMRRYHQEDFAQALGYSRHAKYQENNGPSLADCVGLIRRDAPRPGLEVRELLRWMAFCLVIGNRDNHAKNLSRLLAFESTRWTLSPFYDLVNTTAYRIISKDLALHVASENRVSKLSRASWEGEAKTLGVSSKMVLREVQNMIDAVHEALPDVHLSVAAELGTDARLVQFSQAMGKSLRLARQTLK